MKALVIEDLSKSIAGKEILKGMSFEVEEGEIFGLIGPNGAGKTTTLRIIATLLKPTSGNVEVFGVNAIEDPDEVRKFISYLPEEAGAYKNMRGIEYLRFMASFFPGDTEEIVERGIELSGLGERLKDRVKTYSKGMVRKLLVARALMVRPRLAILDEPTSGLDVLNAVEVRNILRRSVEDGMTILLSSHNMLEIDYLCDRVALIHEGRILEIGTPKDLKERYGVSNLEEVFSEVVKGVETR